MVDLQSWDYTTILVSSLGQLWFDECAGCKCDGRKAGSKAMIIWSANFSTSPQKKYGPINCFFGEPLQLQLGAWQVLSFEGGDHVPSRGVDFGATPPIPYDSTPWHEKFDKAPTCLSESISFVHSYSNFLNCIWNHLQINSPTWTLHAQVFRSKWWMKHWGHPDPKRSISWSNVGTIKIFNKGKLSNPRSSFRKPTTTYLDNAGRQRFVGNKFLRATQSSP